MYEYKKMGANIEGLNKEALEGWRVAAAITGGYLLERPKRVDKNNKELLTEEFLKAWEYYGRHGNRHKSSLKWAKLTKRDKDLIRLHMFKYVSSTEIPGKGDGKKTYRKHLETYLNQRHWENEVLETETSIKELMRQKANADPAYFNSMEYFEDLKKLKE